MSTTVSAMAPTFPAAWDAIAADGPPFMFDPMHHPFPVSPLMASLAPGFARGYTAAVREANLPVEAMQVRFVNHYRYDRMLPRPASVTEPAADAKALMEATLQREIARMLDRWYIEHRPRLLAIQARLAEMRPRGLAPAEVLALLDELEDLHEELWTIHFRIGVPMLLSMQQLRELHDELFPGATGAAETLMAGTPSESMKAAFGLGDLAAYARELGIAATLVETPLEAALAALETSVAGRQFLVRLDAYLEAYGLRQDLFDLMTPTWREQPTLALANVRAYLESGHNPRAEHEAIARRAQHAYEAARARLTGYPRAVLEQFELAVQHGRQGAFLQEEHNFYIDQKASALIRLVLRDVGAHLVDLGVLEGVDDVFLLEMREIRAALGDGATPLAPMHARALVSRRRAELSVAARLTPPPYIGDPPEAMPDSIIARAMMAFFGGPPQAADAGGALRGNPGSSGIASGPARVARTLAEASALRPGEVLVAVTTMPAWTPLFGTAAAVVTETGGVLSHCAIVAREYGVPAVVGVHGATRAIRTGQRVTVDGASGTVTLED